MTMEAARNERTAQRLGLTQVHEPFVDGHRASAAEQHQRDDERPAMAE